MEYKDLDDMELNIDDSETHTSDLTMCRKYCIIIPMRIRSVMHYLHQRFPNSEFSILCNTRHVSKNIFELDEDYFIPEQEVSRAFVNYKTDNPKYNTVIHKHPDGHNTFSETDNKYINKNFDFSILWTDSDEFVLSQMRFYDSRYKIYGYIDLVILFEDIPEVIVPEDQVEKIKEMTPKLSRSFWSSGMLIAQRDDGEWEELKLPT